MQKPTSIDNYIEQFPKDIQEKLEEMRNIIHKAAPKAEETISYSMPAFKINKVIVYFAAFKNHIGFYPFPSGVAKTISILESFSIFQVTPVSVASKSVDGMGISTFMVFLLNWRIVVFKF
jgi:uncharacterized protein YdhG (YjbR/CyaY superfamily)